MSGKNLLVLLPEHNVCEYRLRLRYNLWDAAGLRSRSNCRKSRRNLPIAVAGPAGLLVLTFLGCHVSPHTTKTQAQGSVKNIRAVFAEGKIIGGEYTNDYFGLTLKPVNAYFTKGDFISSKGERARLVDAECNAGKWEDKYEIAILADALSDHPGIYSPGQYLRSVRHEFEGEGLITVSIESPIKISAVPFVQATMKVPNQGLVHYQGMYTTFLNGYALSLEVQAPTPSRLKEIVESMVKVKPSHR